MLSADIHSKRALTVCKGFPYKAMSDKQHEPEVCRLYDGHTLIQYFFDFLGAEEAALVREHMKQCPVCFREFARLVRENISPIQRSPENEDQIPTPSSLPVVPASAQEVKMPQVVTQPPSGSLPVFVKRSMRPLMATTTGLMMLVFSLLGILVIVHPDLRSKTSRVQNKQAPPTIEALREWIKKREYAQAELALPALLRTAQQAGDKAQESELRYFEGRILSNRAFFDQAIESLTKSRQLALEAKRPDLELAPMIPLANIYHTLDRNAEARNIADDVVMKAKAQGLLTEQIAALQILGLSDFLLRRTPDTESAITESMQLLEQHPELPLARIYWAQGYNYLGVIRTEQKRFKEAEVLFDKALAVARTMPEAKQRAYWEAVTHGYSARNLALMGNLSKASNFYHRAIVLAEQANVQQSLALSQLHHGLAECLQLQSQRKQAREALTKAKTLEEEAARRCERGNTFLSFAINCNSLQP